MIRIALCLWLITSAAFAADVDRSHCRDLDQTTLPLVPRELRPWLQFEHAVIACRVEGRQRRFLWWIITVDVLVPPAWTDTHPDFHPLVPGHFTRRCTPKPFIIDASGRELGRISDAFPTLGDPSQTELSLSQWEEGIPRRIIVKVFDAKVRDDFIGPRLQWNDETKYYDQVGKDVCDDP